MPWTPLDDGFHNHRKVITAGLEAIGLYCRALSWCSANLTDGHVPAAVVREMAGGHARKLTQRLVDAGLWQNAPDGWLIHGWTERNPPSDLVRARRDAAADRQRRWRTGQSKADVTPDVTRYVTSAETRYVTPRPSPSPSPTPMSESRPPLSLGTAHAGREDQELPGQTLFSAVRAARERAQLDASKWHDSALESALASASKVHAERTRSELESALLAIASWPDTKVPSRLRHVVEKACREATQSNGQRSSAPLPPQPPSMAELRAKGALGNA